MWEHFLQFDATILLYIQENLRFDWLQEFMTGYTTLGNAGFIWLLLTAILLIIPKTRKTGICCLIAIAITFLTGNLVLKNLIARTRPYEEVEGLQRLISPQADYSFPSGHTSSAFATMTVIFLRENRVWGTIAILAAALMGYSRLYVGVHYLSDVIGGMVLGILCAIFTCSLWKKEK